MRFAIVTLGSAGDLHPFLAAARALSERGHQVHLLSQEPHRASVEAEGVSFIAIASEAAHMRTLQHPKLWHPIDGFGVLWRHLAVPAIGPTLDALELILGNDDEPLVVFASPLAAGARLAKEKWPDRVRLLSGYTAPMGLRSVEDPMYLGAWRVPRTVPTLVRGLLWRGMDQWKLEPMARPKLQAWAQKLGLPEMSGSIFGDWLHGPDGGVALYPGWFAPVPRAWEARSVKQVGFPLFEPKHSELPAAVERFIAEPGPYVVAYGGSAASQMNEFAGRVVSACRTLGLRVVVLAGPSQVRRVSEGELWAAHAPLSAILPGAKAFVHHGGIGSLAQGAAARVPQIVLPSAYDQFENGARLQDLGLGRSVKSTHVADVGRALKQAMDDACGKVAQSLTHSLSGAPNEACRATCAVLESLDNAELSGPG